MDKDLNYNKCKNIIDEYDIEAKEYILSCKDVNKYKDELKIKEKKLINFRYNSSFFYKLTHPVTLIKANREIKKVEKIKADFENIIDRPILEFVSEETGDIEKDLHYASFYEKPKEVKSFMNLNPTNDIIKCKKLKKNL